MYKEGKVTSYIFDCPGCGDNHEVTIFPNQNAQGASWLFNGDVQKPTFSPSIVVQIQRTELGLPNKICHSWVQNGKIRFVSDSTHRLRGQKVELPNQEVNDRAIYR